VAPTPQAVREADAASRHIHKYLGDEVGRHFTIALIGWAMHKASTSARGGTKQSCESELTPVCRVLAVETISSNVPIPLPTATPCGSVSADRRKGWAVGRVYRSFHVRVGCWLPSCIGQGLLGGGEGELEERRGVGLVSLFEPFVQLELPPLVRSCRQINNE
jgi:hypothetical protein